MSTEEPEVVALLDSAENTLTCVFCAGIHDIVAGLDPWLQPCPRIKKIDRLQGGELVSVEFWPPGHWEARVAFLSDDPAEELDGDAT